MASNSKNNTLSKSLDEWLEETQKFSAVWYERYAQTFYERNCSDKIQRYYSTVTKNYYQLHELLSHIKTYGSITNSELCSACKYQNIQHIAGLMTTYHKYEKWIDRLRMPKASTCTMNDNYAKKI